MSRTRPSELYRWDDRFTSQLGDWTGNVYDFYVRVHNKLKAALRLPFHACGNLATVCRCENHYRPRPTTRHAEGARSALLIVARFLESACGDGNFLAEVLRRKLAVVNGRYRRSLSEYEKYAFIAIGSIYGVELLHDNAVTCRDFRLDEMLEGSADQVQFSLFGSSGTPTSEWMFRRGAAKRRWNQANDEGALSCS